MTTIHEDNAVNSKSMQPKPGDESLLVLNEQIQKALEAYLPIIGEKPIGIRFDMLDKDKQPDAPTLCVFLYDIQEDLEVRHGLVRSYQAHDHTLSPRVVHVRCCYLVTYWEQASNGGIGPKSQSMKVMNSVLNALLNANLEQTMPPSLARVIAPSEHLSSLGNFWQSLGDRPHLCLNFQVTIPIELGKGQTEKAPPVLKPMLDQMIPESWDDYDKSLPFKRALVERVLPKISADQIPKARAQLARLAVICVYEAPNSAPKVQLVGLLNAQIYPVVMQVIAENQADWTGIGVQLPVDTAGLTKVEAGKEAG